MKFYLLTSLAIGAFLPLAAIGGESSAPAVQAESSALALVPQQEPKPVKAAKLALPAMPVMPAMPAMPAMPPMPEMPAMPAMPKLHTATASGPTRFALAPRAQSVATTRQVGQPRVLVCSGTGVTISGSDGSSGTQTIWTSAPGSTSKVVCTVGEGSNAQVFTVDGDKNGVIRIVTSNCCAEDSDCCESSKSECGDAQVLVVDGNGNLFTGASKGNTFTHEGGNNTFFHEGSGNSFTVDGNHFDEDELEDLINEWEEQWEELHEGQFELMEEVFEEWEHSFEDQMEAFESSFEEMDEDAWVEMEAEWEQFEDNWEEAQNEWEEQWESQWEDWEDQFEDQFEDRWEEEAEAVGYAPVHLLPEAADQLLIAAELHGAQGDEFGQRLEELMAEYEVLIHNLNEQHAPVLLTGRFGSDSDDDECESKKKLSKCDERDLKDREKVVRKLQREAERQAKDMQKARSRVLRELEAAQRQMVEQGYELRSRITGGESEARRRQERGLFENQQELHEHERDLHEHDQELHEHDQKVREIAEARLHAQYRAMAENAQRQAAESAEAAERALYFNRRGGAGAANGQGVVRSRRVPAPDSQSEAALNQLQDLVQGMQSSIESLRSDLRDLRERVDALSKREFH